MKTPRTRRRGSSVSPLDNIVRAPVIRRFRFRPQVDAADLPSLFDRQRRIPGHDQEALESRHVLQIGGGGLGFWSATALARCGVKRFTIVDPDIVDLTNAHRTGFMPADSGMPKAHALAEALRVHMLAGGSVVSVAKTAEAFLETSVDADLIKVDVDSNGTRLAVARWARSHRIPCVVTGIDSEGGYLGYAFLQGARAEDACLRCARPNMDPERRAPCSAVILPSCLQVAASSVFLALRAVMGWSGQMAPYNLRVSDLGGRYSDRTVLVRPRSDCPETSMHASNAR